MISIMRLITLFILISSQSFGNINYKNSPLFKLLFTYPFENKIEIDEIPHEALSVEILLPKKIVISEIETFYKDLGDLEKNKKIFKCEIKSKGEKVTIFSLIKKNKNKIQVNISDAQKLENKNTIETIIDTFKIILARRFLNDYIKKIEKDISRTDKKQNRIIRNNPKKLEMNVGIMYNIYQKNESKKVGLKSSLETLYKELEEVKAEYNKIK